MAATSAFISTRFSQGCWGQLLWHMSDTPPSEPRVDPASVTSFVKQIL
jgi:hypothetical protein